MEVNISILLTISSLTPHNNHPRANQLIYCDSAGVSIWVAAAEFP